MVELETIVKNSDLIIADTNFYSALPSISDHLRNSPDYQSLDVDFLDDIGNALNKFKLFLNKPKVSVVQQTKTEFELFLKLLNREYSKFNNKFISDLKQKDIRSETLDARQSFFPLSKCVEGVVSSCNSSVLSYDSNAYMEFKELVELVSRDLRLKSHYNGSTADEEIVSAAVFSAISKGKKCSILSNDGDIRKIMTFGLRHIGAQVFVGDSTSFTGALKTNPVLLYTGDLITPTAAFNTSSLKYLKTSGFKGTSYEALKHNCFMEEFWKNFKV